MARAYSPDDELWDPADQQPSAAVVCKHCHRNGWHLFEGDLTDATHRYVRLRCATPLCHGVKVWRRLAVRPREP